MGVSGDSVGVNPPARQYPPHDMRCPKMGARGEGGGNNYYRTFCLSMRQPNGCQCKTGDELRDEAAGPYRHGRCACGEPALPQAQLNLARIDVPTCEGCVEFIRSERDAIRREKARARKKAMKGRMLR